MKNKYKILTTIIIYMLVIVSALTFLNSVSAQTIYYCDTFQNVSGIFCLPIQQNTIDKNNISNLLADNYNGAIIFLENGQNSTYINQTIFDMRTIQNYTNPTNAQIVYAVKREASAIEYIYSHLENMLKYIEWLYKFDKFIWNLI